MHSIGGFNLGEYLYLKQRGRQLPSEKYRQIITMFQYELN